MRYRDILSYSIELDPEIDTEIVPKLLLQPLAENAIYHGIKLKRGGGKITITGKRAGDYLYFCVQDTGTGMSPERLEEIRRALRQENVQMDSTTGSGFGLKNVDMRIRLYYSQQEGLQIESDADGTRSSFRVPAGMEGKKMYIGFRSGRRNRDPGRAAQQHRLGGQRLSAGGGSADGKSPCP